MKKMNIKNLCATLLCLACILAISSCAEDSSPDKGEPPKNLIQEETPPLLTDTENDVQKDTSVEFSSTFLEITDYNLYATQIHDYSLTDEYSEGLLFNTEIIHSKDAFIDAARAVSLDADTVALEKYDDAFFEEKQIVAMTVFFIQTEGVDMEPANVYPIEESDDQEYCIQFKFYKIDPGKAYSEQLCRHFRFVIVELEKSLELSPESIKVVWT